MPGSQPTERKFMLVPWEAFLEIQSQRFIHCAKMIMVGGLVPFLKVSLDCLDLALVDM